MAVSSEDDNETRTDDHENGNSLIELPALHPCHDTADTAQATSDTIDASVGGIANMNTSVGDGHANAARVGEEPVDEVQVGEESISEEQGGEEEVGREQAHEEQAHEEQGDEERGDEEQANKGPCDEGLVSEEHVNEEHAGDGHVTDGCVDDERSVMPNELSVEHDSTTGQQFEPTELDSASDIANTAKLEQPTLEHTPLNNDERYVHSAEALELTERPFDQGVSEEETAIEQVHVTDLPQVSSTAAADEDCSISEQEVHVDEGDYNEEKNDDCSHQDNARNEGHEHSVNTGQPFQSGARAEDANNETTITIIVSERPEDSQNATVSRKDGSGVEETAESPVMEAENQQIAMEAITQATESCSHELLEGNTEEHVDDNEMEDACALSYQDDDEELNENEDARHELELENNPGVEVNLGSMTPMEGLEARDEINETVRDQSAILGIAEKRRTANVRKRKAPLQLANVQDPAEALGRKRTHPEAMNVNSIATVPTLVPAALLSGNANATAVPLGASLATLAYPSLAPSLAALSAGSGGPLLAHTGLVPVAMQLPVTMQVPRRAVRIAPMGVVPLPVGNQPVMRELPSGTDPSISLVNAAFSQAVCTQPPAASVAAAAAASFAAASAAASRTPAAAVVSGGVVVPDSRRTSSAPDVLSGAAVTRIGEMVKGKRRGSSNSRQSVPMAAMTAEERTKQKRMLRNRESAARSRDKQKTRNLELETSIDELNEKSGAVKESVQELRVIVDAMRDLLKKHEITLPF